jgi:16S rRNA U516 pseudouridylate synthase RsuA-like enzyme
MKFSHQKGYLTNVSIITGRSMLRKLKRGIKLVMLTKIKKKNSNEYYSYQITNSIMNFTIWSNIGLA